MALSSAQRHRRWQQRHPDRARASWRKQARKPHAKAVRAIRLRRAAVFISQTKAAKGCVDCSEHDPIVLDFDHRHDKKKCFEIGTNGGGRSLEKIKVEIKKCDVRCANCHRRRTTRHWGRYRGK